MKQNSWNGKSSSRAVIDYKQILLQANPAGRLKEVYLLWGILAQQEINPGGRFREILSQTSNAKGMSPIQSGWEMGELPYKGILCMRDDVKHLTMS